MPDTATYIVMGRAQDGSMHRLPATYSWDQAQQVWRMYDNFRLEGKLPGMQWLAVRAADDPQWATAFAGCQLKPWAVLEGTGFRDTPSSRGIYTARQRAARKAWRLYTGGTYQHGGRDVREQGLGGWFRWPNGRIAAQGLGDLANVCERRGLIVQHGGTWYTTDLARDTASRVAA